MIGTRLRTLGHFAIDFIEVFTQMTAAASEAFSGSWLARLKAGCSRSRQRRQKAEQQRRAWFWA
jgi:hypothetical protein